MEALRLDMEELPVKADFGTAHLVFNNAGTTLIATFENQTLDETPHAVVCLTP